MNRRGLERPDWWARGSAQLAPGSKSYVRIKTTYCGYQGAFASWNGKLWTLHVKRRKCSVSRWKKLHQAPTLLKLLRRAQAKFDLPPIAKVHTREGR